MIPPQANAEFVAHTEDVLELYQQLYDPLYPQGCFDECRKTRGRSLSAPTCRAQSARPLRLVETNFPNKIPPPITINLTINVVGSSTLKVSPLK